jgi:hypothetical protein
VTVSAGFVTVLVGPGTVILTVAVCVGPGIVFVAVAVTVFVGGQGGHLSLQSVFEPPPPPAKATFIPRMISPSVASMMENDWIIFLIVPPLVV